MYHLEDRLAFLKVVFVATLYPGRCQCTPLRLVPCSVCVLATEGDLFLVWMVTGRDHVAAGGDLCSVIPLVGCLEFQFMTLVLWVKHCFSLVNLI